MSLNNFVHMTIVFLLIGFGSKYYYNNHIPKFSIGDCISDTIGLEEWEKTDHEVLKILKVGKKKYLFMTRKPKSYMNTYDSWEYGQGSMEIPGQTLYEVVKCPADVVEGP